MVLSGYQVGLGGGLAYTTVPSEAAVAAPFTNELVPRNVNIAPGPVIVKKHSVLSVEVDKVNGVPWIVKDAGTEAISGNPLQKFDVTLIIVRVPELSCLESLYEDDWRTRPNGSLRATTRRARPDPAT